MDHSAGTYAVADCLAKQFRRLVLLTPRTHLAKDVNYCSPIGIHRRLYAAGAALVFAAEPVSLDGRVLTWRNVFTGTTDTVEEVHDFILATPRKPHDSLAEPLRQAGFDVKLVGDCVAPRNLLCAIHEGEAAAMQL
jgi:hypothetical protein